MNKMPSVEIANEMTKISNLIRKDRKIPEHIPGWSDSLCPKGWNDCDGVLHPVAFRDYCVDNHKACTPEKRAEFVNEVYLL